MLPAMQQALALDRKCGDFVSMTIPVPTNPKANEVVVKVEASALNPIDWKVQKLGVFIEEYPAIVGTDIAGEVVELGDDVTSLVKGDKVFFQGNFANCRGEGSAGYQQYTKADVLTLSKIPAGTSPAQASTIPVALSCAYIGLYNQAPWGAGYEPPVTGRGRYAGQPIFVLGGSSSVGQFAIQLAKLSGFSPIITTSSLKHAGYLESLGATHVLDRSLSSSALSSAIGELTAGKRLEVVYDAISIDGTQQLGLDLVSPGGHLLLTLLPVVEAEDKKVVLAQAFKDMPHNVELLRGMYSKLTEWVLEGSIQPNRVEVLEKGLDGILEGLERMKQDKVSGVKLVVLPQETP
ncbi:GroES-like protein [Coprinopsis marcescibilis]|uniref:GroES-like protein n=1 Tax=Coprinopsis marcescibilis TaxID=230819 RepID=A0A5C3KP37_COPMA|nr:GroES-like protein [Coprinopsis marcescibilis]